MSDTFRKIQVINQIGYAAQDLAQLNWDNRWITAKLERIARELDNAVEAIHGTETLEI